MFTTKLREAGICPAGTRSSPSLLLRFGSIQAQTCQLLWKAILYRFFHSLFAQHSAHKGHPAPPCSFVRQGDMFASRLLRPLSLNPPALCAFANGLDYSATSEVPGAYVGKGPKGGKAGPSA